MTNGSHVYIREGRLSHRSGKVEARIAMTENDLHVVRLFEENGELGDEVATIPGAYLEILAYNRALPPG